MPPLPNRLLLCLVLAALLAGGSMAAWASPPQQSAKKTSTVVEPNAQQQVQGEPVPDNGQTRDNSARNSSVHNNTRRNEDALSDSIRRIESSTRGQVLSAERVPYEGRNLNRIKVVDAQGRVRVYMDDPQSKPASDQLPTHSDDD